MQLELPDHWKKHNVFHVSHLTKVNKDMPITLDAELDVNPDQEFEVESILKCRGPPKHRSYLLKWKDYPIEDSTWVKSKDCGNCRELVQEFENSFKGRMM